MADTDREARMTPDEISVFAASVAGVTARYWARAADAGAADAGGQRLSALWAAGADQGWFALGEEDELDAALAATRELGRVACPLPVADAFVAARVLGREREDRRPTRGGRDPRPGCARERRRARSLSGRRAGRHARANAAAPGRPGQPAGLLRPITACRPAARPGRPRLERGHPRAARGHGRDHRREHGRARDLAPARPGRPRAGRGRARARDGRSSTPRPAASSAS